MTTDTMRAAVGAMSDEEIIAVRQAQVGRYGACDVTKPYSDSIAFARAIVAALLSKAKEEPAVLNAVEVLKRMGYDADHLGTAGTFLAVLWGSGMWVIENPLTRPTAAPKEEEPVGFICEDDIDELNNERCSIEVVQPFRDAAHPIALYTRPIAADTQGDAKDAAPLADEAFIGWKLVPITPTMAMLDAASHKFQIARHSLAGFNARELAYKALLDAAPSFGARDGMDGGKQK